MKVTLLDKPNPEICGLAAALCYDSKNPESALKHAMDGGHESVLEHTKFTFLIEGVSRALLAQIIRHRIASFSVQSQRYVKLTGGFPYVIPQRIEALGKEAVKRYKAQMEMITLLRIFGVSNKQSVHLGFVTCLYLRMLNINNIFVIKIIKLL